ncbi:fam-a protein [Plasmodium vinckei lentum]|uniref:Fam-a protein n=1 Tax=Plasmodium vinckei lentum TaxID=138297 RepID=A0A6V7S6Z1_PLAVN|nr:fam-a protein [Plasmodium vinckei lentum]
MNKFYIQIVLFLLSVSLCVSNKTLATEPAPRKVTTSKSNNYYPTSEEIYEKNKHLLCTDPKEINEAVELMNDAVKHLEFHAKNMDGYKICESFINRNMNLYIKKHEKRTYIEKIDYAFDSYDKYPEIINEIWDPDHANPFNNGDVKIVRVYNPNLVMIQQRYKKKIKGKHIYFYALATKVEISQYNTIIAYVSPDINDHNPYTKKYENKVIEKANSFKTDIDSEDDIRKGKLRKVFVNLSGYYIQQNKIGANVTYIESIDGHTSIQHNCFCGKCCNRYHIHK